MSIFAIGNGKVNGELGTGNFEERLDPVMLETIKGKTVVELKACEANAVAITDTGDLFVWGRNREGTLGIGSHEKSSPVPVKVQALDGERIETAAVGANHVLAVTKQGRVYHWGKLFRAASSTENREYFGVSIKMTGLAGEVEDETTARKRRLLDRSHQAYYANKGGRGGNEEATGEHETNMDFGNFHAYLQRAPLLIEELALANVRVTKVAAGYGFSLMVTDAGQVWSLGINEKFQLGLGHRFNQDKPQLIKTLAANAKIVDVACGQQHCMALDEEKKLWSWGLGVFGQLGHSSLRDEPVPRKIVTFTINAVTVPIDDGDETLALPVPESLQQASKDIHIDQIACGAHHTLALDSEGRIWSWGSAEYGQQGGSKNYEDLGTREGQSKEQHFYYSIPRMLTGGLNGKRPLKIACGNLHNIAVTEDGCMWTWGWGQTGALGHGNRRFQLFPTVINALRGDPIRCIAGGARTTFAVTSGTSTSFAFDFLPYVNNPQYSDLTIHLARKKVLRAHKVIVFARCPALRAAYELGRRFGDFETSTDTLRFPKIDPLVFQGLLNYLYSDHLRVPPHLVGRLAVLALRLRLPRLVSLCERFLSLEEGAERDTQEEIIVLKSTWEDDLRPALDDPTFADFVLQAEGGSIFSHRLILHARCEYFATLFTSAFTDSNANELDLSGMDVSQLSALLHYLYTNATDHVDSDNIVELLHSSDRFLVEDLKQTIELKLEQAIDDDSVVDALLISESTATPRLRNACFSRIIANIELFKKSPGLKKLRDAMPTTLRELDYVATKRGLIDAGSLIRCH
jgi:alpha-tubulin suppressor-like RCC1 family protein